MAYEVCLRIWEDVALSEPVRWFLRSSKVQNIKTIRMYNGLDLQALLHKLGQPTSNEQSLFEPDWFNLHNELGQVVEDEVSVLQDDDEELAELFAVSGVKP